MPLPIDMLKRMLQIIVRSLCITETWLQLSAGGLSLRRIPDGKIVLPEVIERGRKRIIFRCGTNDLSKVVALYEHYMIYEDLFFIFQPSDHAHELASEFFPEVCQAFLADVRRFGKAFLYLNTEVMHMWGLLPTSVDGQAAATQLRRLNEMECPRA